MRLNIETILEFLAFLVFFGFLGLENYLVILAFLLLIFNMNYRNFHTMGIFLFLILVFHAIIFSVNYGIQSVDWYSKNLVNPTVLFEIGYILNKYRMRKGGLSPIWILIFGFFLHGALNVIVYELSKTSLALRELPNVWGGGMTATLQNLLFVPITSTMFHCFIMQKSKFLKYITLIFVIVAFYSAIITASRTFFFILGISVIIGITTVLFRKLNRKFAFKIYVALPLEVIVIWLLFKLNSFSISKWLVNSPLLIRLNNGIGINDSLLSNIRWQYNKSILNAVCIKPFGKIGATRYAHNLWLDMAKFSGLFPALGLFVWSFYAFFRFTALYFTSKSKDYYLIYSVFVCSFVSLFLEPILEGLPIFFGSFCFTCGILISFISERGISNE